MTSPLTNYFIIGLVFFIIIILILVKTPLIINFLINRTYPYHLTHGLNNSNEVIPNYTDLEHFTDWTICGITNSTPVRYKLNNKLNWDVFNIHFITNLNHPIYTNNFNDIKLNLPQTKLNHRHIMEPFSCIICYQGTDNLQLSFIDNENNSKHPIHNDVLIGAGSSDSELEIHTTTSTKNIICMTWCGHYYHKTCLETWLLKCSNTNLLCPLCRNKLIVTSSNININL
jgi:hypothetical protein